MAKKSKVQEVFYDGKINIIFKDGLHARYDYHLIRCSCPCAACVDELTGEKILDDETIPADIHPVDSEYVGNYALRIKWSDGHDSGLFRFADFRDRFEKESSSQVN